jgi:methionine biosynthesis protein MetW
MALGLNRMGDNREYEYTADRSAHREEFSKIVDWIPEGSRVLDLGCGEGSLLKLLVERKKAKVEGIEISPSGVEVCRSKGLNVRQGRIDEGLPWADGAFDIAVCNVTLQMVMYPEKLLSEMGRVATRQIVSFPNFANLRNRVELFLYGRMPRAMLFGYTWWNTGHIHQLSIQDFKELVKGIGLEIKKSAYFGRLAIPGVVRLAPNLLSTIVLNELVKPKTANKNKGDK